MEQQKKNGTSRFSFETIENFDSHIEKSIMGYDNLQDLIINLSSNFIRDEGTVVDVGCSTGKLLQAVSIRHSEKEIYWHGIDNSVNLLPKDDNGIKYSNWDITESLTIRGADLVYLVFTLQFIEPSKRFKILADIYMGLRWGGALIVAEKIYCKSGKAQDFFTFAHYDIKALNFKAQDIFEKQRDLRPIMHPMYEKDLMSMFTDAGFKAKNIELFWGSLQFRAWILIK